MKHVGTLAAILALAGLMGCADTPLETPSEGVFARGHAPLPGGEFIRYIVVFREDVHDVSGLARQMVEAHRGALEYTYEHTIRGFAARLPRSAAEALRQNPRVRYVQEDQVSNPDVVTQTNATWGLDRIDQQDLPLNGSYRYRSTGQGVRVYVVDSGIRTSHSEFAGRASVGWDLVGDGRNGQDCNGHGTHVAGTIAGATYGVAKQAHVVSVRIFGCTGGTQNSRLIAALDSITAKGQRPAVVNMSLGGGYDQALNEAVQRSIYKGFVYVVSAGNESIDACTQSPASTAAALTSGASTSWDARAGFSNWGSCVDLFAPGADITSAWWGDDAQTNTISGTSMASPHVAGAAALYLQRDPSASPAIVHEALVTNSTVNRVSDAGPGSPNRLLRAPLRIPIHRTYNHGLTDHNYGHDPLEGGSIGYVLESRNYFYLDPVATAQNADLYRCFNSSVHDHFLSRDWNCEGRTREATLGRIATSQIAGTIPLYRLVDPTTWDHLYTTSYSERQSAMNSGWREEGITGYVFTEW